MKKFVFVLMPFASCFDDIYKLGIKEISNHINIYIERVDEQIYEGSMLDRIYNQINHADLIIADLTNKNPNVFYEVGYAHALFKNVILITQDGNDIPFDMKHFYHIVYSQNKIYELKEKLSQRIEWFLNNVNDNDSNEKYPIKLFLNDTLLMADETTHVSIKIKEAKYNDNYLSVGTLTTVLENISNKRQGEDTIIRMIVPREFPHGDFHSEGGYNLPNNKKNIYIGFANNLYSNEISGREQTFEWHSTHSIAKQYEGVINFSGKYSYLKFSVLLNLVVEGTLSEEEIERIIIKKKTRLFEH